MRDRLQAQAALAGVGFVFICLGTLASRSAWLAAVAMAVVGFGVLFAGVVSSVLAGATVSLLLAFILPVSLPGSASSIPDRLAGWGLASAASFLAVALLWPAPARNPCAPRPPAACRALAARLRTEIAYILEGEAGASRAELDAAIARSNEAVAAVHRTFFATPYRPTGLSTTGRAIVRLVDELNWLNGVIVLSVPQPGATAAHRPACPVKARVASVLERGAELLEQTGGAPDALDAALAELRESLVTLERNATIDVPARRRRRVTADRARHVARPELPRAGARASRSRRSLRTSSSQPRPSGEAGCRACSATSRRTSRGRSRRRGNARPRISIATRSGCTTACAARSAWPRPCSSPTCRACSTRSGSSSGRSPSCARTRSARARTCFAVSAARSPASSSAPDCWPWSARTRRCCGSCSRRRS